ncbi:MAG: fatty acid desaturase [Novosphingobium sp.]|nr:fatty acid desaturase [Novosphingobium sp.]
MRFMVKNEVFERGEAVAVAHAAAATGQQSEDRDLLIAAARIARELSEPAAAIYWTDLAITAGLSYGALAGVILLPFSIWSASLALVAVFGFYRGLSFIHELSHIRPGKLPGFRTSWNLLFGIPLLVPSFLYDEVHLVHHSKLNYGTVADPEYLQIGRMKSWQVGAFIAVAALAPIALLARFALLAPASLLSGRLRQRVLTRWSSLAINHGFRRRLSSKQAAGEWRVLEGITSCWALTICSLTVTGAVNLGNVTACIAIGGGVALVNQVRTLVSHVWSNETGGSLTLIEQYQDSVNLPEPNLLTTLLAPVGLRYHALHHLMPSLPYHALPLAHRRMVGEMATGTAYSAGNYRGVWAVFARIRGYDAPLAATCTK